MPNLPIDIQKIAGLFTSISEERDAHIVIDIITDIAANPTLVKETNDAFECRTDNCTIHKCVLDKKPVNVSLACDLCVIVAGKSFIIGDVVASVKAHNIPAVVLVEKNSGLFTEDKKASALALKQEQQKGSFTINPYEPTGISSLDLVEINLAHPQCSFAHKLGPWIMKKVSGKKNAFACNFKFMRTTLCSEIIRKACLQNMAISCAFFMPAADLPIMTMNQVKMVLQIASAYGYSLSVERIPEIAVIVASAFVFRTIARRLSKLCPKAHILISIAVSIMGTLAMGYVAKEYFEKKKPSPQLSEGMEKSSNLIFSKIVDAIDINGITNLVAKLIKLI